MLFIRRIIAAFGWLSPKFSTDNWKKSFQDGLLFAYYHYPFYPLLSPTVPRVRPVSRKSEYRRHEEVSRPIEMRSYLFQGSSEIFVKLYVTAGPVHGCHCVIEEEKEKGVENSSEYVQMEFESMSSAVCSRPFLFDGLLYVNTRGMVP